MRILLNLALALFVLAGSALFADKGIDIERILLHSADQPVSLGQVMRGISNLQVRYALTQAQSYQEAGDLEMRNRMLSLSLSLLEMEELEKFSVSSSPRAAVSSEKQNRFQQLYGEEGLLDGEDTLGGEDSFNNACSSEGVETSGNGSPLGLLKPVEQAVDVVVDSEKWFVAMLEKLGVLSRDYKELNGKLRTQYPNLSNEELADHLIKQSASLTAGVGFASALPSIIPGVGTAAKLAVSAGSMLPDMIYLFKNQATLIFRIAELYGKDLQDDDRITEALILFGLASGVSAATKALERYIEAGITVYVRAKITEDVVLKGINQLGTLHPLLRDILTTLFSERFLTETAVQDAVLGVIPLIGAGISGATNYIFTRKVGQIAKIFYGDNTTGRLDAINGLSLPKVELAMFRALVLSILADGVKSESEILGLNNFLKKFPHNRDLVEAMLDGDRELLDKCDYDISHESQSVKEQIMYSILVMQYIDGEKSPTEIEFYDKIAAKFGVSEETSRQLELQVRKERKLDTNGVKSFVGQAYRSYQKLIGAEKEVNF